MKKSIVIIMAHADDIELSAGGTLAKYIAEGYQGLYGVMSRCNSGWTTTAEKGGHYISSLEIIPQRRKEAEESAKVFGAELFYGDLLENCYTKKNGSLITPSFTGTGEMNDDDIPAGIPMFVAAGAGAWEDHPFITKLADILLKREPELVIGQNIGNLNPDHFAAALIMARAWLSASKKSEIGPYWIPVSGKTQPDTFPPLVPNHFVDITGYEEKALTALACHKSQGMHLHEAQESRKKTWKEWGNKAGYTSAEAFVQVYPKI